MAQKPIFVVLARQRSGTTALNLTLSEDPSLHSFGEVLHGAVFPAENPHFGQLRLQAEANYFAFRMAAFASQPRLSVPTKENQYALFRSFIAHLTELTGKPRLLMDVKYNSMHHFDPVWHGREEPPALLDLLKQQDAAVIHVVRSNHFERYCSEQLARARQTWHAEVDQDVPDATITIKPAHALRVMERSQREITYVQNLLKSYPRHVELSYETLFDGNRLSTAAQNALRALVGPDVDLSRPVPLRKLAGRPETHIANMGEVRTFFARTRFAPLFEARQG